METLVKSKELTTITLLKEMKRRNLKTDTGARLMETFVKSKELTPFTAKLKKDPLKSFPFPMPGYDMIPTTTCY